MNVKEFVRETLVQIVGGAVEADESVRELGGEVNPVRSQSGKTQLINIHPIEFDIAVTVESGKETEGGVGLSVASIAKLGTSGHSTSSESTVSRIKFSLPLKLPTRDGAESARKTLRERYEEKRGS